MKRRWRTLLILAGIILTIAAFVAGIRLHPLWFLATLPLILITGVFWAFSSRYGERLPPGDNRPTVTHRNIFTGRWGF